MAPRRSVRRTDVLADAFGRRAQWVAQVCDRVAGVAPVAAGRVDRDLIGRAVEHAIGLDLAADAYTARRALLPPDQRQWVTAQVERYQVEAVQTGGPPGAGEPVAGLLCAAFWLARWDNLLFHGTECGTSPEVIRDALAQRGRPADDRDWLLALPELAELLHRYASGPRSVLADRTPVVVAPVLERRHGAYGLGPAAVADVIVGDMLVEVKAGVVDRESWLSGETAVQMMRYALLAPTAGHPVAIVALYLARYGLLLHWEVTALAQQLAGQAVDLDRLRGRLMDR